MLIKVLNWIDSRERAERDGVWLDTVDKKCIKNELPFKSVNGIFQTELLSVFSKRAVRCEKEKKAARRRSRGRQRHRETRTWKTCLFLSSSQLGLWKSRETQCEAVFCWRSVPFPFFSSLLWACGFLITASLNQCLLPWSLLWWIKAIILVGSGQFVSPL